MVGRCRKIATSVGGCSRYAGPVRRLLSHSLRPRKRARNFKRYSLFNLGRVISIELIGSLLRYSASPSTSHHLLQNQYEVAGQSHASRLV